MRTRLHERARKRLQRSRYQLDAQTIEKQAAPAQWVRWAGACRLRRMQAAHCLPSPANRPGVNAQGGVTEAKASSSATNIPASVK